MTLKRLALALLVAYSLAHFAYSGVLTPLASPNIRQIAYEIRPLLAHIASGKPVQLDESDQYGPVFFFIMHPMILMCGGDAWPLSRCAYGLELATLAASFGFAFLALRRWLRSRNEPVRSALSDRTLFAVLLVLWLNYSPLNYIVATKGVEMWELALIMAALYAALTGRHALGGVAIAAATLIKILPGIFILYFLFRDRRALVGSIVGAVAILASAEALYGHQMGFGYPWLIAKAAVTTAPDAAVGLHTNLAMKNLVIKAFGRLEVPTADQLKEGVGASVTIDRESLRLANMLGLALHAIGLAVVIAVIARRRTFARGTADDVVWHWAFLSTMMIVIAPAATYEYMVLCVFGFSFSLVWLLSSQPASPKVVTGTANEGGPASLRGLPAVLIAVSTLLVANILPRTMLNELLPLNLLRQWSGYTHLTLSEIYQYFGIPLFGLIMLAVALLLIRQRVVHSHPRYQ